MPLLSFLSSASASSRVSWYLWINWLRMASSSMESERRLSTSILIPSRRPSFLMVFASYSKIFPPKTDLTPSLTGSHFCAMLSNTLLDMSILCNRRNICEPALHIFWHRIILITMIIIFPMTPKRVINILILCYQMFFLISSYNSSV